MRLRRILGFVMGALLLAACQDADRDAESGGPAGAELTALRQELAAERELRRALEAELAAGNGRIEALAPEAAAPPPAERDETDANPVDKGDAATTEAAQTNTTQAWFDADSLLIHDIPPHEVERIHEHFGHSQMAQIELQHQAMREGWFKTPRFRKARRQIASDFRAEIGDEDYDLLLYGSGKHNRVVVADVVDRSPGSRSGFRAGDVIFRYDDVRVFGGTEIQRASTAGDLGETVPVDILRDGEIVRLYIDRGPMGFGLEQRLMWPHHLR